MSSQTQTIEALKQRLITAGQSGALAQVGEIAAFQEVLISRNEQLEAELAELKGKLSQLEVPGSSEQVQQYEAKLFTANARIAELEAEVEKLKEQLTANARIAELEAEVEKLKEQLTATDDPAQAAPPPPATP